MTDTRATTKSRRGFLTAAGAGAAGLAAMPVRAADGPPPVAPVNDRTLIDAPGWKTFVLVMGKGDEVLAGLTAFVKEKQITAAHITGVGGFGDYVLGYFDHDTKDHLRTRVTGRVQVLSLAGDVVLRGEGPMVHLHTVVGLADGSTRGGCLLAAHVWPTLELVLTESPKHLHRRYDPETGLALIRQ